jgi:tetratricopeptide (TPR) repeat protein
VKSKGKQKEKIMKSLFGRGSNETDLKTAMPDPYKRGVTWIFEVEALAEKGEYQKALQWCDEAIKNFPRFNEAWHYKGMLLNDSKQSSEAIDCYLEAMRRGILGAAEWLASSMQSMPANVLQEYKNKHPNVKLP